MDDTKLAEGVGEVWLDEDTSVAELDAGEFSELEETVEVVRLPAILELDVAELVELEAKEFGRAIGVPLDEVWNVEVV